MTPLSQSCPSVKRRRPRGAEPELLPPPRELADGAGPLISELRTTMEALTEAVGELRAAIVASGTAPPAADPEGALNAREAARRLGVSERKLWSLTATGEVPHAKIGRRTVYPVAALEKFLAARLHAPGRSRTR